MTMATLTTTAPVPARTVGLGRRALRGIGRALLALLALIVALVLAGGAYEAIASGGDAAAYPAPGQMVSAGGIRLHIYCTGAGSPTVVLDAGLGASSLDWSLVQPELSKTTRVCAYDRAGMGWSDPGPAPRSPSRIASELRTLLTNAGVPGPYVLVAHSLGGKNVRLFAAQQPDAVAGMVLVDARSEYVDSNTSAAEAAGFQQAIAAQGTSYGLARRLGVARLAGPMLWGAPLLPAETSRAMALVATRPQAIDTTTAEAALRAADDPQLSAAPALGALPLIVLVAGVHEAADPVWMEAQRRQAALSTDSRLIVVKGSGHGINVEQPAVVIDAARQVIAKARGR